MSPRRFPSGRPVERPCLCVVCSGREPLVVLAGSWAAQVIGYPGFPALAQARPLALWTRRAFPRGRVGWGVLEEESIRTFHPGSGGGVRMIYPQPAGELHPSPSSRERGAGACGASPRVRSFRGSEGHRASRS